MSARSIGSRRSATSPSSRLRSSRSVARRARRRVWRPAVSGPAAGVLDVRDGRGQRLVHQLDGRLQEGERRAQLVRRGPEERLARALLGLQPRAHGLERAREVADLVAARVARERRGDPALAEPPRALAQALQAPQKPEAQGDPEEQRDRQPGERRRRAARRASPPTAARLSSSGLRSTSVTGPAWVATGVTTIASRSRSAWRSSLARFVPAAATRSADSRAPAFARVGVGVLQRRALGVEQLDAAPVRPLQADDDPRQPRRPRPQVAGRAGAGGRARPSPRGWRIASSRSAAIRCSSGATSASAGGRRAWRRSSRRAPGRASSAGPSGRAGAPLTPACGSPRRAP